MDDAHDGSVDCLRRINHTQQSWYYMYSSCSCWLLSSTPSLVSFPAQLSGEWKNLRRAFKKLDQKNQGYLSLPEFRSVLKLANIILDEDEIYHLMSHFDEDMTGKISYTKFLNETFKPESRMSQSKMPQHVLS